MNKSVAPNVAPTMLSGAPMGAPNRKPPPSVTIVAPGRDSATTTA